MLVGLLMLIGCGNEASVESEDSNSKNDVVAEEAVDKDIVEEDSMDEDVIEEDSMDEDVIDEDVMDEDVIEEDSMDEDVIDEDIIEEDSMDEDVIDEDVIEEDSMDEDVEEEIQLSSSGELVFKENVSTDLALSINEEKVQIAIEMEYPSPNTSIDVYEYMPQSSDVIQYKSQENMSELEESLSHKGFEGLEIVYEKFDYRWNDFFGDLEANEEIKNITVDLKGNSIYEEEIIDEYMKFYRYYNENKGLYYEVNDFMMGNYTDGSELVNKRIGNACNYSSIEGLVAPSYNPLIMQSGEERLSYFVTALDDKPCLYIESLYSDKLYKRWIDIEFGVVIKELVFDNEGLIKSQKIAISITEKDILQSMFEEPKDIEFKDITLFIYSFEDGDVETLVEAIETSVPDYETGILLTSDQGGKVTIYTSGLDDLKLDDAMYYSKVTLDSGETRTIREIKDNRFYTVCDELETVEIYDKSCYEKKFFDFETVGLLSVKLTENGKNYSFYDPNNISVSALYDVYEYVIEDGEIKTINFYSIESIKDNVAQGDIISYEISLIDYDPSMYDESCMDTYKIIDHGEGSFNDGENMPFWFDKGEK
jgi:hypothetical protein